MQKNKALTSRKRKVKDNSSDQHSTKKTKADNVLKRIMVKMKTQKEKKRVSCMTSITMIQSTQKAMKNILKIFANFLSQIVLLLLITPAITQEMQKTFLCQNGEKHSFNHG